MKKIFGKLKYIFSPADWRYLVFLMVMTIIGGVLELLGVSIFYPFTNMILHAEDTVNAHAILRWTYDTFHFSTYMQFMILLTFGVIILYLVKNAFLIILKHITYKFSFRVQKTLATRLLHAYMREPYTFHLSKNISELQRTLQDDVANFSQFVMQSLELIAELCVCVMMAFYLLTVSKTITIIVGVLLVVCVFGFTKATRAASRGLGRDCQTYRARIYQWINQSIGGIKEVKVLERENYFLDSFTEYYEKYARALRLLKMLAMVPKYIVEGVSMTGLLLAIIIKLAFGEADMMFYIPQLTVFALAAFRLFPAVGRINGYVTQIISTTPSVDLIYHDLKEVDHYVEEHPVSEDKGWRLEKEIKVDHVSYTYPGGSAEVLKDVSFTIPRGATAAFIGPSGAGKTTMADIILGLLSPDSGQVLADGINVHENLSGWHAQIGYIPQTIYLADESIRENIAFGVKKEEIDDAAVERALHQAQLDEFVATLPEGADTFVGDRGVRLSGGQRQRIGIARALYHNPEILVLDEATSALDNETETAVMESIDHLQGLKTMIIIAHRLQTIEKCDMVYRVKDGRIERER